MTHSDTPNCPVCRSGDVTQVGRSLAGRRFRCGRCGERWGISLEDEVLGMIGESLRSRDRNGGTDTNP